MQVGVSELRASLRSFLERVRSGEEVVVTERGVPVARIVPAQGETVVERLQREGVISPPRTPKPQSWEWNRVTASGPVADLVSEQRR